jgi:uncharacterized protein
VSAWRAALLLVALAACASSRSSDAGRPPARVVIETAAGQRHTVAVEVARTDAELTRGLMHRERLAPDAGMLFVFDVSEVHSFWMKDTLIPLDIAFVGARGRILRVFTMTPCRRDPCRVYDPGVRYRSALEVNAGSFRRWGVRVGDRVRRSG